MHTIASYEWVRSKYSYRSLWIIRERHQTNVKLENMYIVSINVTTLEYLHPSSQLSIPYKKVYQTQMCLISYATCNWGIFDPVSI